jgi:tetratricopeptide (TPR) repeat protein
MSARKTTTDTSAARPAAHAQTVSPALARSVSLHLEGKHKDALTELNTAIENGEGSAELYAAKGHLQFELEHYADAIKLYREAPRLAPRHNSQFQHRPLPREARPLE